jgi:hypothetical protein
MLRKRSVVLYDEDLANIRRLRRYYKYLTSDISAIRFALDLAASSLPEVATNDLESRPKQDVSPKTKFKVTL